MKRAVLRVLTVDFVCPHCGADQPNPETGALWWDADQIRQATGTRSCFDCGQTYTLKAPARAAW